MAEISRFRSVKAARLVLTQVRVRDAETGFRITTSSIDAPRVEDILI